MKNQKYIPCPADTSRIELPEDLSELTERMARNVHEVWAQTRIQQGWSYGPERDDRKKHHPCLVPYDELSESEREYDRKTALETLKFIVKAGYRIDK